MRGQTALLALRSLSCAVRLEAHQPEAADLLRLLPRGRRAELMLVVVPLEGDARQRALPALAKALAEATAVTEVELRWGGFRFTA